MEGGSYIGMGGIEPKMMGMRGSLNVGFRKHEMNRINQGNKVSQRLKMQILNSYLF